MKPLRAITYLAPGLPLDLFQGLLDLLGDELNLAIELTSESRISGPMSEDRDPFALEEYDLGFVCSPSYLYLRSQPEPSVDLVPAGFAFEHPRAEGRAVYFSDVLVREETPAKLLEQLCGSRFGFNDECSLSGYFAVQQRLREAGCLSEFFANKQRTGSHHASIEALHQGRIDVASVDSTTLSILRRQDPERLAGLRVVESMGPFPVQPMVVRRGLGAEWPERLGQALLSLDQRPGFARLAKDFGLQRLIPMRHADFAEEQAELCALGRIASPSEDS